MCTVFNTELIVKKEGNSMNKNPIIPFILIFGLGIGLIFFMSLYGLEQKEDIAKDAEGETEESVEVADFDAEVAQGKCISCHGGSLEGGVGPDLTGGAFTEEEIIVAIQEGVAPMMPAGLIPEEHLDEMAEYILSLK